MSVLQARFRAVYGTQTFSNNNNWLRRKLLEGALPHLSVYLNADSHVHCAV